MMIEILETCEKDLGDVQRLWADGDVMRYVGFPEGLWQSDEEMGNGTSGFGGRGPG